MKLFSLSGVIAILLITMVGCAHGKRSPVAPEDADPAVVDPTILPFACADLVIDADAVSVQVEQRSMAAAGESLTIDLSDVMREEQCLRIEGIRRINADTLGLTIGIRHPIPMPPLGQEPKFHATDMLGVFVFDDAHAKFFGGANAGFSETIVPGWLDADGYTKTLHNSFTEGLWTNLSMHPYVLLSEDTRTPNYDPGSERGWLDVRNPVGYNVFPQGSDWRSTEARLHLPSGQHPIRLAVQGHLQEVPLFDGTGQPQPARYCYPEGNTQAPWKVETEVWNDGLLGGVSGFLECEVDVKVYDWQQSAEVSSNWSPITTKGAVREKGSIAVIMLDVPDLMAPRQTAGSLRGTGQPDDPSMCTFTVYNHEEQPGGFYWGFVVVQDWRNQGRRFDRLLHELPETTKNYCTGQVVAIPIATSSTPDFITRLSAGPTDQVFVGVDAPKTVQVRAIWASGASTPIDKSAFVNALDSEEKAEMVGDWTIRRLTSRDSSLSVVLRTVPRYPGLRVRATTTVELGDPYVDGVGASLQSCGNTGSNRFHVAGGPEGGGTAAGNSTGVYSLGYNGYLVASMSDGWILDKPGPDFIVFENPAEVGGNPDQFFTEAARVAVSVDDQTYVWFPTDYRPTGELPWRRPGNFSGFAGIHPVFANVETNSIDPTNPVVAGGDAFDLADVELPYARYVAIMGTGIDSSSPCFATCSDTFREVDSDGDLIDDEGKHSDCSEDHGGPDIDAIAIVKGHQGFPDP